MTAVGSARNRLFLLAMLATVAALLAAPASARIVYTGNYDDRTVSAIDTTTNQVVGAPIPVGVDPYTMAIAPNGTTHYVANATSDNITIIDTRTNQPIGAIQLEVNAATLAISPDGKTAWMTEEGSPFVRAIDLQTNQVSAPIAIGETPWGIAVTPDGKFVYALNSGDDNISVIDTATRQVVGAPIPTGDEPINVGFSPDGKTAYVTNNLEATVTVIDTSTRQPVGAPIQTGGEEPWGLAISPDGSRIYVSDEEKDTVTAIDTATRQVVGAPIPTGLEPYELALTPDGKSLYVTNYEGDSVTVINTQTLSPATLTIPVPGGPWQVVIVPDQSPTASFSFTAKTGKPVGFNGSRSTDSDGLVTAFNWSFGDGKSAANAGPKPRHKYAKGGKFKASLSVVDNEGCSTAQVFTGRTAYCSGSAASTQVRTVNYKPSNLVKFGKLTRNAKTGTAKLKVKVPGAGKLVLSGKQVKKAQKRAKKAGTIVLTVKPKSALAKALRTRHEAKTTVRVTFTPTGGKAGKKSKSVKLVRH